VAHHAEQDAAVFEIVLL